MPAAVLGTVFAGREPLDNPALLESFRTLVGASGEIKPFECVGDVEECVTAALIAAGRADRAGNPVLGPLAAELMTAGSNPAPGNTPTDPLAARSALLQPQGPHRIPARHFPASDPSSSDAPPHQLG